MLHTGILFGAAVPTFEDDMDTLVDQVTIHFRVPPAKEAMASTCSVIALFKREDQTFQAEQRLTFTYLS